MCSPAVQSKNVRHSNVLNVTFKAKKGGKSMNYLQISTKKSYTSLAEILQPIYQQTASKDLLRSKCFWPVDTRTSQIWKKCFIVSFKTMSVLTWKREISTYPQHIPGLTKEQHAPLAWTEVKPCLLLLRFSMKKRTQVMPGGFWLNVWSIPGI